MASKDYIRRNREWLSAKATEDGVRLLSDGVYYKVLSGGDASGKHPSPTSIVTVHYTGRTIDGKEFDSSIGGCPPAMRLNSLINGWIVALRQMCVGDKWEIYIPAEMGYGRFSQPGIPGGSTLIFDIELIGVS